MNYWLDRDRLPARVAIYLAKFALFVAVPGLHMLASGYRIAGSLTFLIYTLSLVSAGHLTIEPTRIFFASTAISYNIISLIPYFYLPFLLLDIRYIEIRVVGSKFLFIAASYFLLIYLPVDSSGEYYFHLENDDLICPAICDGDVVVYDFYWDSDLTVQKI